MRKPLKTTMKLRLPEKDMAALDTLAGDRHRSTYLKKVFEDYLSDKAKVIDMISTSIEDLYDENSRENNEHNPRTDDDRAPASTC